MGLDITFHIGSKPCTPEEADALARADCKYEAADNLGLSLPRVGTWPERCSDLDAVAYRDDAEIGVCAGAYSGYNRWREGLALLAGISLKMFYPEGVDPIAAVVMGICPRLTLDHWWAECEEIEARGETPPVPFWQLIHFSDCEGTLGPAVCKSLADDFDRLADKAATHLDDEWREFYGEMRSGFRAAADSGGWVGFH